MFTICSFNSPDLDGHRAPKMKYCPRRDPQRPTNVDGQKSDMSEVS